MRYMGGKSRIAKYILPIILKDRMEGQWYVEPFCGGCNTLSEVTGPRIGADSHYYLIEMWRAVANGWLPPVSVTEINYLYIKNNLDSDPVLSGYVGFQCSFGARFMGTYAKSARGDDYAKQGHNNALKQFPKLKDVIFKHCSYGDLEIPNSSIIYCDPPYEGTTDYKSNFNYPMFWEQVRTWTLKGHKVFVSEYKAPDDFVYVWSKERTPASTGTCNTLRTVVEKLFVHESQLEGVE